MNHKLSISNSDGDVMKWLEALDQIKPKARRLAGCSWDREPETETWATKVDRH